MGVVIIGIEGLTLQAEEVSHIRNTDCAGVILFSRNYQDPTQLGELCTAIRTLRPDALLCVDQEGGRVQRFRNAFSTIPPAAALGRCFDQRPLLACQLAEHVGVIIAYELRCCGINFSFTPVLDLLDPISTVIGERAFHANPAVVSTLATALRRGMRRMGMAAVGKHYPGHGRVQGDSHHVLPYDERSLEMREADLYPFLDQIHHDIEGLMPAHIVFPHIDSRPAGFSPIVIHTLRQYGFDGAIISDDLDMVGALGIADPGERIQAALTAGADVTLMCNNFAAIHQSLQRDYQRLDEAASARRLKALRGKPFDAIAAEPYYLTARETLHTHMSLLA
ncbi:MAG: beta-N-acetylhexosaminidase [Cardiobacteriaceae bacterium]|nr:beta-N-acetylhexosaminidase [Cardiobacteriaceae bacterium]